MARAALLAAGAMVALSACSPSVEHGAAARADAVGFLAEVGAGEYARVTESRAFRFPEDHGSHDGYRNEWWYFTGNLRTASARHFGFELTFFRFALTDRAPARQSAWGASHAWMAHLALTDTEGQRFVAAERFSREALGLSGYGTGPFHVWVEDWSATSRGTELTPLMLHAGAEKIGLELTLEGGKRPVAHGEGGMDRKGPEPGNASHYYSLTRLEAGGQVRVGEETLEVTGLAWMDREWGSSSLGPELAGWDWFGLQLTDGRELMYYRLRTRDGRSSPYSGGSLVDTDGTRRPLTPQDVVLTAVEHWSSPQTGVRYPVGWELSVPDEDMTLRIRPYLPQQELDLTVRYWEGAVRVAGSRADETLGGSGYVELTGY